MWLCHGCILQRLRLSPLLGMMLAGILLEPYALNLISPALLSISADIRQIALIIILLRAGLALDLRDLKKVGRPSLLMCFVPATFELLAVTLLTHVFLGLSYLDAAVLVGTAVDIAPLGMLASWRFA